MSAQFGGHMTKNLSESQRADFSPQVARMDFVFDYTPTRARKMEDVLRR